MLETMLVLYALMKAISPIAAEGCLVWESRQVQMPDWGISALHKQSVAGQGWLKSNIMPPSAAIIARKRGMSL